MLVNNFLIRKICKKLTNALSYVTIKSTKL